MTTTNMMRIMTAIDSRVAKGTPDFKDVMMTPGQPLSFNEPGGFQPSGEPVTEEDIAAFISLACGLKDRANGAITQNDIVGTTKHCDHVLDVRRLEEAEAAILDERDVPAGELKLQRRAVAAGAE